MQQDAGDSSLAADRWSTGSDQDLHFINSASQEAFTTLEALDILGTIADPVHTASFAYISSSLVPSVDDQVNLGSSTKEWKDLFIDGTANIDTLSADNADIGQLTSNFIGRLRYRFPVAA